MKVKDILFISMLLSFFFAVASCSDDNNKEAPIVKSDNQAINDKIYAEMSENYYWNEQMPKSTALNFNDEPSKFFYKTLNKYNVVDRFSYIEKDGIYQAAGSASASTNSKTIHNEIGFEFQAFIVDSKGVIELLVTYIKKGTEVEKQNLLHRGDWISKVDGASINENNFRSILYTGKASYVLTLRNKGTLTLQATASHNENPICYYDILPAGNKKVGYVLYNSFANGKDDNSYEYALEMNNEVLKYFETNKIDELILDLRYNGGGLVESGTYIASAIAPNRSGKIYTRRNYNSTLEKIAGYANNKNNYFHDEITVNKTKHTIPQLNLTRLYVITSQQTASASEQIINGLRAYLPVEVVGETTVGKNMESFAIPFTDDKKVKWKLHPLTSISYRSDLSVEKNDYSKGFAPTIGWQGVNDKGVSGFNLENDEFQTFREHRVFYAIGNLNETLLAKTLENISGVQKATLRKATKGIELNSIGSSLDRKRQEMLIEQLDQE